MQGLIHLGNILILLSYLVRDILWLRAIAIVASLSFAAYFALRPSIDWPPVGWNILFVAVNLGQAGILLRQRRAGQLLPHEESMWRRNFRHMEPFRAALLIRSGQLHPIDADTMVLHAAQPVQTLSLLVKGGAVIALGGQTIARCEPGDFLGEMAMHSSKMASADVQVLAGSELLQWQLASLDQLAKQDGTLQAGLHTAIAANMADKLRRKTASGAHVQVEATQMVMLAMPDEVEPVVKPS